MEAKRAFLDSAISTAEARVSGTWITDESGILTLNIGIKDLTQTDRERFERVAAKHSAFHMAVNVVDVAYSGVELEAFQDYVTRYAVQKGLPIAVSVRPDVGRLEVTLGHEASERTIQDVTALVPDCVVVLIPGDPRAHAV